MDDKFQFDLDKQRFFIAISEINSHTFLMLGAYTDFQVDKLLCRVGKVFESRGASLWQELLAMLEACFTHTRSCIHDEGTYRTAEGNDPITYYAYDISYNQYLELIHILEALETNQVQYWCYKPLEGNVSPGTLELTANKRFTSDKDVKTLLPKLNQLYVENTCRHSAIDLAEAIHHTPVPEAISPFFGNRLPYNTQLQFGAPTKNISFYVLPPPPSAYKTRLAHETMVLQRIYLRLEEVLYIKQSEESTMSKFKILKDYYLNLAGNPKPLPLIELLENIKVWRLEHQEELSSLRERYVWDFFITRTSKTDKVLDEIEQELTASLA